MSPPLSGTSLLEQNSPLRFDDPPRAVGFEHQKLFSRHRYPVRVTRRCPLLTVARRFCSSEGGVKAKDSGQRAAIRQEAAGGQEGTR